jgi:hypothetical protein
MSTLQKTPQHHDRIRTRPGTALALGALIAIGLALLILIPTGHRTSARTASSIAQPAAQAAGLTAQSSALAGCFRDPATHARTCFPAAPALTATPAPAGLFP